MSSDVKLEEAAREYARRIVAEHYGYDVVENVSDHCAEVEFVLMGIKAARHQPQREAVLEEAARRLEREWPGPASNIVRALKTTPTPAVSRDDQALLADIFANMAEVLKPLPGIPDAPGQHAGTRATESGEGDL